MLRSMSDFGVRKVNFVGGEPMLNPNLEDWIVDAKSIGMTTSIVAPVLFGSMCHTARSR